MGEDQTMGPVSYLIVEFPGNQMTGDGFSNLVDLVDKGLIRILDLKFIMKDDDGAIHAAELSDLDRDGVLQLDVFEGSSSGVMDDTDFADAASVIAPGSAAGVLLFENRWAAPFTTALRRTGAEVVAAGYIPLDELEAALDTTEPAPA